MCHNVFVSRILQMRQNASASGKGLNKKPKFTDHFEAEKADHPYKQFQTCNNSASDAFEMVKATLWKISFYESKIIK